MIKVGDKAPEFTLTDHNGEEVKLSDFEGQKILISWHPLAFTSICTDQMRDLERYYDKLEEKGIDKVLGVSVDAHPSKKVWYDSLGMENVVFLSDFEPKAEMSKAYDVYNGELGTSGRGTVVIEDGEVIYAKEEEITDHPDIEEVLKNI